MLLQVLVGLSGFRELRVHELVLSGKGLDVLGELRHFSSLDLYDLALMLDLLPEVLVLLSERLDFVFVLEESSLEVVLFPGGDSDLVLHVGILMVLLLVALPTQCQVLGFGVEFGLNLIDACIKGRNRVSEVDDLLILDQELSLVVAEVVQEDGSVTALALLVLGLGLESLDQLFLVLVQVFHQ